MKNNLGVNFMTNEQFDTTFAESAMEKQLMTGTDLQREPRNPKGVDLTPTKDISETGKKSRTSNILKVLSNRISWWAADSDSMASSSSSDSMSGKTEDQTWNSGSDSSTEAPSRPRRHRSSLSLYKVFQSLSLSNYPLSSLTADRSKQPKKQKQPKRILRPPVTYTYVKGLSGLPTQRVPRYAVNSNSMGLNR